MNHYETQKPSLLRMVENSQEDVHDWGFSKISITGKTIFLDWGCRSGKNVEKLLHRYPKGRVWGIDSHDYYVKRSLKRNAEQIEKGRCKIIETHLVGSGFPDKFFDMITAFDTTLIVGDLDEAFIEAYRILKDNGTFFLCNEATDNATLNRWFSKSLHHLQIHSSNHIEKALEKAGFTYINIEKNDEGWTCFTAQK